MNDNIYSKITSYKWRPILLISPYRIATLSVKILITNMGVFISTSNIPSPKLDDSIIEISRGSILIHSLIFKITLQLSYKIFHLCNAVLDRFSRNIPSENSYWPSKAYQQIKIERKFYTWQNQKNGYQMQFIHEFK